MVRPKSNDWGSFCKWSTVPSFVPAWEWAEKSHRGISLFLLHQLNFIIDLFILMEYAISYVSLTDLGFNLYQVFES